MSFARLQKEVDDVGGEPESAEQFADRMFKTISNGFTSLGIAIGKQTGMFETLAKFSEPKTSQEIADAKGYKERYVREWLGIMVTTRIVEIDDDKKFFLPKHHVPTMLDPEGMVNCTPLLPMFGKVMDDLHDCFKADGPRGIPYSRYPGFQQWRESIAQPQAKWENLSKSLSSVPGILERLEEGIVMCDMGTGPGTIPMTIAERFPKSTIWGLDISEEGIEMARKEAAKQGLKNTEFHVQDICSMPADWTNKWDLVTMFDVAHDLPYTSKMMREVVRVLKPGGYFLMFDIALHTDMKANIGIKIAPSMYTSSLFHCMVVSLNEEGGEGLGTAWGIEKAVEMLKEAGFAEVSLKEGLDAVCRKAENV